MNCLLPPAGWRCTRGAGHPGPCAAVPAVAAHEPDPVKNASGSIQDLVIADLEARKQVGLQRYGTLLQPFNGRDALMDLYQEILDAANYCRQELEERRRDKLAAAATALYLAGRWECADVPNAAKLWEDLRDALGLPPGTATSRGMGDASVTPPR